MMAAMRTLGQYIPLKSRKPFLNFNAPRVLFQQNFHASSLMTIPLRSKSGYTKPKENKPEAVDLSDTEVGYKSKTMWELVRASTILYACSFDVVVRNSRKILETSQNILGKRFTAAVLQPTLGAQFTGGENLQELDPIISQLRGGKIGAILDFAVEGDQDTAKPPPKVRTVQEEVVVGDGEKAIDATELDRQRGAMAHVFLFEGKDKCEEHFEIFSECISAAAKQQMQPFAAIKLTALTDHLELGSLSSRIMVAQKLFLDILPEKSYDSQELPAKFMYDNMIQENPLEVISTDALYSKLSENCQKLTKESYSKMLKILDPKNTGFVDYADWIRLIDEGITGHQSWCYEALGIDLLEEPAIQGLKRCEKFCHQLGEQSLELGVITMVDAEQTYLQPGIDSIIRRLQRTFNKDRPIIYNTFQCYLKDTFSRVTVDLVGSQRENRHFGCKFVRGAYITQETALSSDGGPCWGSKQETDNNYNRCLELAISHVPQNASFMVASHNELSVQIATQLIRERQEQLDLAGISMTAYNHVYFAHLYGMADHITNILGQKGYLVYKYLPYGPFFLVLEYLIRRIEENSTMLAGEAVQHERAKIAREIRRRLGL
eukprot:m.138484 g.138484  ORF g.138484 m.138484 type:complete len:604 (+) comp14779_c0_seq4:166-1977(+)